PPARRREPSRTATGEGSASSRGQGVVPGNGAGDAGGAGGGGDGAEGTGAAYGANPLPPYPLVARRLGMEGVVLLEVVVAPDGHVFVVNPDSDTVGRLEFDASHAGTLTHEAAVGKYPRTLALAAGYVFTADQNGDTVSRLDQADLGTRLQTDLGFGCNPYGVAATPGGDGVLVTCQGTSELVLLDLGLTVLARVQLAWPNARAIA